MCSSKRLLHQSNNYTFPLEINAAIFMAMLTNRTTELLFVYQRLCCRFTINFLQMTLADFILTSKNIPHHSTDALA